MKAVSEKRLYLLDAANHIFRAYYAIRGLTNSDGEATNAVYGYAAMLRKLIGERKPGYLVSCWVRKEKTFRHKNRATTVKKTALRIEYPVRAPSPFQPGWPM